MDSLVSNLTPTLFYLYTTNEIIIFTIRNINLRYFSPEQFNNFYNLRLSNKSSTCIQKKPKQHLLDDTNAK